MYNSKKREQEKSSKDSKKALKPPPPYPSSSRSTHQRLGTGDSQKNREDEQTDKICAIIRQYLQKSGYTRSAQILSTQKPNRRASKPELNNQENIQLLVPHFEKGNREEFFKLWQKWFQTVQDISFKKLEFELHIYFYIYPIHPEYRKTNVVGVDNASIEHFKKYLETKGSDLSRTTEFLSFYALPYIQKPQEHPSISHVFTKEWLMRLKQKLVQFIKANSKGTSRGQKTTVLQSLYRASLNYKQEKNQSTNDVELEQLKDQNESLLNHVHNMQENFRIVSQASKDNILQSQAKWFQFSKEILILAKRAMKGDKVQARIRELEDFFQKNMEDLLNKDISIFERNSITTQDLSISPHTPSISPDFKTTHNQKSEIVLPIDSVKILNYLAQCDKPQNQVGAFLVLQALRRRFTKLKNPYTRREVVVNYSIRDLCAVLKPNWKIQDKLLFKSPTRVKVCYLRLLNYITSDYVGINYLNKEPYLISNLIKVFKQEKGDNSVKKHSLGVLQKLSLLRQPQEIMLREGILVQIIHLLNEAELSDYNVQYLTALLMNLSLRKLGKPKLEEHKVELAQLIYDYLLTDNIQVKNYINGTLYSFLEVSPSFRQLAIQIGVVQRVNSLIKNCDQNLFVHQYELILQKLNSKSAPSDDNSSDQDDDELDYDDIDEQEETPLADDDKESQCQGWEEQYLSGQQLLMKEFPLLGPDGMKEQMVTRTAIDDNKKVNTSSISRSRKAQNVFGGRPATPSLNGMDNQLERSLLKYSRR